MTNPPPLLLLLLDLVCGWCFTFSLLCVQGSRRLGWGMGIGSRLSADEKASDAAAAAASATTSADDDSKPVSSAGKAVGEIASEGSENTSAVSAAVKPSVEGEKEEGGGREEEEEVEQEDVTAGAPVGGGVPPSTTPLLASKKSEPDADGDVAAGARGEGASEKVAPVASGDKGAKGRGETPAGDATIKAQTEEGREVGGANGELATETVSVRLPQDSRAAALGGCGGDVAKRRPQQKPFAGASSYGPASPPGSSPRPCPCGPMPTSDTGSAMKDIGAAGISVGIRGSVAAGEAAAADRRAKEHKEKALGGGKIKGSSRQGGGAEGLQRRQTSGAGEGVAQKEGEVALHASAVLV